MDIATTKNQLTSMLAPYRASGQILGLVPTMGNLHDGHLSLIEAAKAECTIVASTIFVNPLQFGKNEDLNAYPRTLTDDLHKLEQAGCDLVFTPDVTEMYASELAAETIIHVPEISENYCGKSRPGHFDGVATIVSKLFNLAAPNRAYFGLKDYQQFLVIKKMARDLAMPIEIIGVPIKREPNGLAMSSRNNYLSAAQRSTAAALHETLEDIRTRILAGSRDFESLASEGAQALNDAGMATDYFAVCNADDLTQANSSSDRLAILAAAYLGKTRLIDNVRFSLTN